MNIDIVTKQDLEDFKRDLLNELQKMLSPQLKQTKWLKSAQVREILGCSASTLQTMRINGIIRYSKVLGTMYYPYDSVMQILEGPKSERTFK
jgi:hypothetical protein